MKSTYLNKFLWLCLLVLFSACTSPRVYTIVSTPTSEPEVPPVTVPDTTDAPSSEGVRRIDLRNETPERSVPEPIRAPVNVDAHARMALSHDQRLIAVVQDRSICTFRADTMELLWCTPAANTKVNLAGAPVWSADDSLVASFAFTDVTLWDAVTGRIRTIPKPLEVGGGSFVNTISWGGCADTAYVSFSTGQIGKLDPLTNSYSGVINASGAEIIEAFNSSCDTALAVMDSTGAITFVDPSTGEAVSRLEGVTTLPVPSPDASRFVVGQEDAALLVTTSSKPGITVLGRASSKITGAEWSPDGSTVALMDVVGVTLWDVASGKPLYRIVGPVQFNRIIFTPDNTMFALLDKADGLSIWDTSSGRLLIQTADVQNILFSSQAPGQALMYSAGSISVVSLQ